MGRAVRSGLVRGGTKLKVLGGLIAVIVVAIGGAMAYGAATSVRQLRPANTLTPNGVAERKRVDHALDYSVATTVHASPEVLWKLLVDAPAYTTWNSTIVKLDGDIAKGSQIKLVSKDAPGRTFGLKVTTFEPPKLMVWEDGGPMFMGVRTFTLTPAADGSTVFAMSETLSGTMLPMIEGSLPDFAPSFTTFAADLKKRAEAEAH